jgi:hypothetical protein
MDYTKLRVVIDVYQNDKGLSARIKTLGAKHFFVNLYSQEEFSEYVDSVFDYLMNVLNYRKETHRYYITLSSNRLLQELADVIPNYEFFDHNFHYDLGTKSYSQKQLEDFLPKEPFTFEFVEVPSGKVVSYR